MTSRSIRILLGAALLASGLAACGGTGGGGSVLKDSEGNPIVIGGPHDASTGPGKPGWPEPTGVQRAH